MIGSRQRLLCVAASHEFMYYDISCSQRARVASWQPARVRRNSAKPKRTSQAHPEIFVLGVRGPKTGTTAAPKGDRIPDAKPDTAFANETYFRRGRPYSYGWYKLVNKSTVDPKPRVSIATSLAMPCVRANRASHFDASYQCPTEAALVPRYRILTRTRG